METLIDANGVAVQPTQGAGAGDLIKETDSANFMTDVVEMSKTIPVIVDFWAPWCEPCKTLGPLLEKLVQRAGGLVRMVKINVDDNQQIAAQLQVQSVPTVFGFKNGQPVDGFAGAQPESQLQAFIDRLTEGAQAPVDQLLADAATALETGALDEAHALYAEVLGQDGANAAALGGLIRLSTAQGDLAGARDIFESLTPVLQGKSEVTSALAALELEESGGAADGADVTGLRDAVAANESDHQARFDLAMGLYGAGQISDAMDELIEIIKRERSWNEEAARLQLLQFFEALGPVHEETVAGRQKLSVVLFS